MNYGKAVEEVWAWREALGKELEGMSPDQQREHLNNKADHAIRKYGMKVKKLPELARTSGKKMLSSRNAPTKPR
jgi:hypothetical protein